MSHPDLATATADGLRPGSGPGDALDPAGCRVLRTFVGLEPTPAILAAIGRGEASGVTLFRHRNVGSVGQVQAAAADLQAARPAGDPPLLIGLDQEGGQLQALGGRATAWPGNLALGAIAARDPALAEELAEAAGLAIGQEAAAVGANLVFAPVCDVLQPASATPLGTRSFGSNPVVVGRLAAAMVRGLQAGGVAAVLKHFPGHGSAMGDSHLGLPVVADDAATINARDLPPFREGIAAGAMAVLPGHLAAPALTRGVPVAATVAGELLVDLLRGELGFEGVTVSDALDMGGAGTAGRLEAQAVRACAAGMDLLMLVHPPELEDSVVRALAVAMANETIDLDAAEAARRRIWALRSRLDALVQPPLDVLGSDAHRDLARRIAWESITLVRDPRRLLPLGRRGPAGNPHRVAWIAPVPVDLTPAETSSYLRVELAAALRGRGVVVRELVAPLDPTAAQVAALIDAAVDVDLALVGTFDAVAHPGQAALVRSLVASLPTIAIALRSPYDIGLLPPEATVVCTYGIQPPQIEALAAALAGEISFASRLPIDQTSPSPALELEVRRP
jgi:beta-N-acetylhexosaminidase